MFSLNLEIVERSSGFWVVDENGAIEGPIDSSEEAIQKMNDLVMEHKVRNRYLEIALAGDGIDENEEIEEFFKDHSLALIYNQIIEQLEVTDPELAEWLGEKVGPESNGKQQYDRTDICDRINEQIKNMSGKELINFCENNFGGLNHTYDYSLDMVEFDLE